MRVAIICPSCGARPEYSKDLAIRILEICETYFAGDFQPNRKGRKPLGLARQFTLHFVRAMTGEQFKRVGEIFHITATAAADNVGRLELNLDRKIFQHYEQELVARIRAEIPAEILNSNHAKLQSA
jgi:hypothetical protein